jgi:hypothetical protein
MDLEEEKDPIVKPGHDEDLALARKLQEEEQRAEGEFRCRVCYDIFVDDGDALPLSGCSDVFHKECLKMYLKA